MSDAKEISQAVLNVQGHLFEHRQFMEQWMQRFEAATVPVETVHVTPTFPPFTDEQSSCGGCGERSAPWEGWQRPDAGQCWWLWDVADQMWLFACRRDETAIVPPSSSSPPSSGAAAPAQRCVTCGHFDDEGDAFLKANGCGASGRPHSFACPGCDKVARHPGEGYMCGFHPRGSASSGAAGAGEAACRRCGAAKACRECSLKTPMEQEAGEALVQIGKRHGLKGCDGGGSDEPCYFPRCLADGCDGGGGGAAWEPEYVECIEEGCKAAPLRSYLYCHEHLNPQRKKAGLPWVDEDGRVVPCSPTSTSTAAPAEPISGAEFLAEMAKVVTPRSDEEIREMIAEVHGGAAEPGPGEGGR